MKYTVMLDIVQLNKNTFWSKNLSARVIIFFRRSLNATYNVWSIREIDAQLNGKGPASVKLISVSS